MSWVSSAYASGPVSAWGGKAGISINISNANPATVLPQGVLYAIGTQNFSVPWVNPAPSVVGISGSDASSGLTTYTDRTSNFASISGAPNSWIAIDFDGDATGRRMRLDHLFMQHGVSNSTQRLRDFVVEVGNGVDLAAATWTTVATVSDPSFFPASGYSWSNRLDLSPSADPVRFFRVRLTGVNADNNWSIFLSEFEFGGAIIPGSLDF